MRAAGVATSRCVAWRCSGAACLRRPVSHLVVESCHTPPWLLPTCNILESVVTVEMLGRLLFPYRARTRTRTHFTRTREGLRVTWLGVLRVRRGLPTLRPP